MKTHERYVCAILQNPEWLKSVAARYGRDGVVGMPELATAVTNLHNALTERLDVDEDSSESD